MGLREDRKVTQPTAQSAKELPSRTAVYPHNSQQKYRVGQSIDKSKDQGVSTHRATGFMSDDSSYDLYGNHRADSLSTRSAINRDEESHEIPRLYSESNGYMVC